MSSRSTHNLTGNNNLIGFLAKKSLFKNDRNKQKSSTQITDQLSRSIGPKYKNQSKSQISQFNVFRDSSQKQLFKKGISQIYQKGVNQIQKQSYTDIYSKNTNNKTMNKNRQQTSQIKLNKQKNTIKSREQNNRFNKVKGQQIFYSHLKQTNKQQNNQQYKQQYKQQHPNQLNNPQLNYYSRTPANNNKTSNNKNNLFTGFRTQQKQPKSQPKTFDSLQTQSANLLQQLSFKLHQQILTINQTIQSYNAKMFKLLNSQLQNLKVKVLLMVQQIFKQNQKHIKAYIKNEQNRTIKQMKLIKNQLSKQYSKLEQMKVIIKTNQWRKIAAQIIATDLQNHIDSLILKSSNVQIKLPQVKHQHQTHQLSQLNISIKQLFHNLYEKQHLY